MEAYTLKKRKHTNELHLFKGRMINANRCNSLDISICSKMDKSQSEGNTFTCFNEDEARITCAQLGRDVCGSCVSHLYANND